MSLNDRKLIDDCFLHDKDRLPHEEAITLLRERLEPIATIKNLALQNCLGAILAEDIFALRNIPSTDNSAVDGYAYCAQDYDAAGGFFPVTARIAAGQTGEIALPKGSAARIFTGAVMPEGADTIAMQEDCEPHEQDGGNFVAIPPGLKPGANRRKAGEDLNLGDEIATKGTRITPQLVAAFASCGISTAPVFAPLKIALISSGDELKEPGHDAVDGEVYDSNRYLLSSLLKHLPVEITDYGIQPDNYEKIEATLKEAATSHDIIVTSGGASRGEEDHIITALDNLGKRHLWQLAVKPGRPMSFGQIDNSVFFGLPGNPVACFICFLLYVRPSLLRLAGSDWHEPRRYMAPAGFEVGKKKPDRREFWRGMYEAEKNKNPQLRKFARDGSGLISGLREADGLIEIPEDVTSVSKGDLLRFIPWTEFGI